MWVGVVGSRFVLPTGFKRCGGDVVVCICKFDACLRCLQTLMRHVSSGLVEMIAGKNLTIASSLRGWEIHMDGILSDWRMGHPIWIY